MWNKDKRDAGTETVMPQREPELRMERQERPAPAEPLAPTAPPAPSAPVRAPSAPAMIGRSISIRGEVTGDEDLVIQGCIEGSVDLKQHAVTIGPQGEVRANVIARIVTVEGKVDGNLSGEEQVILRASARVSGDIVAPRVVLEDGTLFRGSVEMTELTQRAPRAPAAVVRPEKAPDIAPRPPEVEKRPAGTHDAAKPKATAAAGAEMKR